MTFASFGRCRSRFGKHNGFRKIKEPLQLTLSPSDLTPDFSTTGRRVKSDFDVAPVSVRFAVRALPVLKSVSPDASARTRSVSGVRASCGVEGHCNRSATFRFSRWRLRSIRTASRSGTQSRSRPLQRLNLYRGRPPSPLGSAPHVAACNRTEAALSHRVAGSALEPQADRCLRTVFFFEWREVASLAASDWQRLSISWPASACASAKTNSLFGDPR